MAVWVILSYISYVSGSLGHYLLPARRERRRKRAAIRPASKSKTRPTGCSMWTIWRPTASYDEVGVRATAPPRPRRRLARHRHARRRHACAAPPAPSLRSAACAALPFGVVHASVKSS